MQKNLCQKLLVPANWSFNCDSQFVRTDPITHANEFALIELLVSFDR